MGEQMSTPDKVLGNGVLSHMPGENGAEAINVWVSDLIIKYTQIENF